MKVSCPLHYDEILDLFALPLRFLFASTTFFTVSWIAAIRLYTVHIIFNWIILMVIELNLCTLARIVRTVPLKRLAVSVLIQSATIERIILIT